MKKPPTHDLNGLNLLDPNDNLGRKSEYITLLQETALMRYLPEGKGETAVDVGCGYGRITPLLQQKGWRAIGIDPSENLLTYAVDKYPGPEYRKGQLPDLPLHDGEARLMLLQNLLRALKLLGVLHVIHGIGRFVAKDGYIVVVDNIRDGHPDYIPEPDLISLMENEHMKLVKRVPIRAARWWIIYAIRYGLIPPTWFQGIVEKELYRMGKRTKRPRRQYYNVMFIFQKKEDFIGG